MTLRTTTEQKTTTAVVPFPLGYLRLSGTPHGLHRLEFIQGQRPTTGETGISMPEFMSQAIGQLQEFLQGKRKKFTLELTQAGTAFQQSVWSEATKIPYGETITYRQLAERIANPKACRAVGQALHRNPLPIFIPCHRIIGTHGNLTGFTGGVAIKRFLLQHEHQVLARS